jgi:hypothetical protein
MGAELTPRDVKTPLPEVLHSEASGSPIGQ